MRYCVTGVMLKNSVKPYKDISTYNFMSFMKLSNVSLLKFLSAFQRMPERENTIHNTVSVFNNSSILLPS